MSQLSEFLMTCHCQVKSCKSSRVYIGKIMIWPVVDQSSINQKVTFWDTLFNTFYKYDPCFRRCIQQWWECVCLINLESWIQFGEELGIERQLQIHSRLWRRKEELMHFANYDWNQVIKRFSIWHFWFVNNQRRCIGEGPSLIAS